MRILFAGGGTGGHLYPGIAIARAVQRLRPDVKPFFVGARRGIEPDVLPGTGYPHILLDLHPLYRRDVWNNWRTMVGMTTAWAALGRVVKEERPRLVVGTGGYAAVAALAYAVAHSIPIVEQTGDAMPSLTARTFSRWAREVYLSFPESAKHFTVRSPDVLVDSGAPIEPPPSPKADRAVALTGWGFPRDAQVVLVYGGSQGSIAINSAVGSWVAGGLPANIHLIWGTGRKTYEQFAHFESDRVRVRPFLSPIGSAYAATDIALTRAGTMTVAELLAWHIPSILVPLPTAAADHQTLNAIAVESAGAAKYLPQANLSTSSLSAAVHALLDHPDKLDEMRRAAAKRARPDAAAEIARRIVSLLSE